MKYWAYMNNEILGPFEKEKLLEIPQFSNSTLICPQAPVGEKTEDWREAATYPEIAAILSVGGDVKDKASVAELHSLKPIAAGDISREPPVPEPDLGGPKIEVNRLKKSSEKNPEPDQTEPQKQESISPEPAHAGPVGSSSEKYDPISISEIGRKNPNMEFPAAKFSSNIDPISLSQISRKQQNFSSPASAPNINEIGEITKSPGNAAAPEIHKDEIPSIKIPAPSSVPSAPAASYEEILRLIEKLASNSADKDDINNLKNYLDSRMDDINRKIADIKVSNIDGSIKNIDGRLSMIEDRISRIEFGMPSAKADQLSQAGMEQPYSVFTPEIVQQKAVSEPAEEQGTAPAPAPEKPTEEKEKKKFSLDIGKILKPAAKAIIVVALIAAVAGVTVFALKQAGIIDLTGYITNYIPLPFLTSGQPQDTQPEQVQSPAVEVSASTQTAVQETVPEQPRDLSEEVVYFSRTYSLNSGGMSLENAIMAIARKRKANINGISWQAKQAENQIYSVNCLVPMKNGKLEFSFEADYNAKTLKPLNAYGKAAMDLLAPPERSQGKKTSRAKKAAPKRKKEIRKAPEKPAEDEEYVYEYVDEDDVDGQEEYVMPGVPKK